MATVDEELDTVKTTLVPSNVVRLWHRRMAERTHIIARCFSRRYAMQYSLLKYLPFYSGNIIH